MEQRMDAAMRQMDEMLNVIFREMDKHNTLILKMLEKDGLISESECPSCSGVVRVPLLHGIEVGDDCVYCGASLDGSQKTLDDFTEEE
jgi:hypothetical protein